MNVLSKLRSVFFAFVALGITLFLPGCLQVEQVIKVKPDGSGTVTVSIVMTNEGIKAMAEFAKQSGGEAKSPVDELASEEKAREQAKALGEGVKFEKVEKIKNAIGEGAKMTFSFTDVTKLKPSMDMGDGGAEKEPAASFEFTKGSPAKLVMKMIRKKAGAAPDVPDTDDSQFQEAAKMMKGMKLTMYIEVDGQITESDAAHREGSRVTFAEVPFDEILKSPEKFKAMNKAGEWSEAVKVIKEIPGVKVEPKDTVTIQFK